MQATLCLILIKKRFQPIQLTVEIISQILRMQSNHRPAQIWPRAAHAEQIRKCFRIDIGQQQILQPGITCSAYNIGQVITERLIIDVTMSVNQFHPYGNNKSVRTHGTP